VYRTLLDAEAVQEWMVPEGMTSQVHLFDPREGGMFRISLTYDTPTNEGKTSAQTDSFHGRFVKLVPDTEVVEVVEFETDDPALRGERQARGTRRTALGQPPNAAALALRCAYGQCQRRRSGGREPARGH
jgi:uncharacterized protein YndB with AHSA1/START domain